MPVVDFAFSLRGKRIPFDHGYAAYAALCGVLPSLHRCGWLGVHPISGMPNGDGYLQLHARTSLILRIPVERIPEVLPLAGKVLSLSGDEVQLGLPTIRPLIPAAVLDARLVVIKLTEVPHKLAPDGEQGSLDVLRMADRFRAELARQLAGIDVRGEATLCGRGRIAVGGRRVVGYSVRVTGLDPDASLRLQEHGLGGKRAMGCGIFRRTRA